MRPDTLVIVNQSTGDLTVDVCNAFVGKYKFLYLICGNVATGHVPLNPSIKILNIVPYDKSSVFRRLKAWCLGSLQIKKHLARIAGNKDVLYFTNPPMSYFWADKTAGRFGIVEYDLYPDALQNIRCPKFLINWWAKRNIRIFSKCSGIITLSDGMKQHVARYCNPDIIRVVPNWSTLGDPEIVPQEQNQLLKELNLEGKFIVMYSGNIGFTHNVETLIDAATAMKQDSDIHFLIIGQGGKRKALQDTVINLGLDNVTFHDFLPSNMLKYSMSAASIGVVTLTSATANASVPSKTYNMLGYGIPLLNIAPPNTEVGKIIEDNDCGISCRPDDITGITDFIRHCCQDKEFISLLKANALSAGRKFTPANALKYTEIFD